MSPTLPPGFTIPDQKRFTLAEAAQISGFSLRSIEEGCRARRIKHHRMPGGRQRYMTKEQLVEFIASTLVEPEPKPRVRVVGISRSDAERVKAHRQAIARELGGRKRGAA
jgi:hypothetical protein